MRTVSPGTPKYRVMLLGDSFTEGLGFPYGETFVGIFANAVERDGVEVLNAAVSSYSPRLYFLKCKYFVEHNLKIDEVFVFLDISDIQDEAVYAKTGSVWGAFSPEAFDLHTLALRPLPPPPLATRANRTNAWIANHFNLISGAYLGYRVLKSGQKHSMEQLYGGQKRVEWLWARAAWTTDQELYNDWGREGLEQCREYMEQLAKLCAEHRIKLRVAVYPWPHQILTSDEKSIQSAYWRAFCASWNIPFLDYFPIFVKKGQGDAVVQKYYVKGDVHWNRNGHEKVAEVLTKFRREIHD